MLESGAQRIYHIECNGLKSETRSGAIRSEWVAQRLADKSRRGFAMMGKTTFDLKMDAWKRNNNLAY